VPTDATDRLKAVAESMADKHMALADKQMELVKAAVLPTNTAPPPAAADRNYFNVTDGETLHSLSEDLADRFGSDTTTPDAHAIEDVVTSRLAGAAAVEAAAQPATPAAAPAVAATATTTAAAATAAAAAIPKLSIDLASPNTLDAETRKGVAWAMAVLAVISLGVAVAGLVIGDGTTSPGSMPVLCVVVAIIAAIGAMLITLGYGSVRLGSGTTSPADSASSATTPNPPSS
jgi:hypothetical protein